MTPGVVRIIFLALTLGFPPVCRSGEEARERVLDTLAVSSSTTHPIVGERLSFHGRWLGIPVGRGWVEVQEITEVEGHRVYHIAAQVHSNEVLSAFYPIHDVVHSYLDITTLRPIRFEKYQREGHYRSDEVVTFDYSTNTATYRSLLNESVKTIPISGDIQDLISAFYWLRAQPIQPDETLTLKIYTDEKIYQTDIEVKRPVLLELLKRGTFPCLVVEPKASFKGLLVKRGRLWAYLTADAYRLPMLVKVTTPWGPMSAIIDETSLPPALKQPSRQSHPASRQSAQ